jgi:hypothetical protein
MTIPQNTYKQKIQQRVSNLKLQQLSFPLSWKLNLKEYADALQLSKRYSEWNPYASKFNYLTLVKKKLPGKHKSAFCNKIKKHWNTMKALQ